MPQLGTLWRQFRTKLGPTERQGNIAQHEASPMPNTSEIACFDDFVLCRPCAPFWSQVGPKLEPSGPELGRSWLKLTPRPCRIEKVTLDYFVPICETMQNVQITIGEISLFGTGSILKMLPHLNLYKTDRSVHSYHSVLNYHASAPSVRAEFMHIFSSKCLILV